MNGLSSGSELFGLEAMQTQVKKPVQQAPLTSSSTPFSNNGFQTLDQLFPANTTFQTTRPSATHQFTPSDGFKPLEQITGHTKPYEFTNQSTVTQTEFKQGIIGSGKQEIVFNDPVTIEKRKILAELKTNTEKRTVSLENFSFFPNKIELPADKNDGQKENLAEPKKAVVNPELLTKGVETSVNIVTKVSRGIFGIFKEIFSAFSDVFKEVKGQKPKPPVDPKVEQKEKEKKINVQTFIGDLQRTKSQYFASVEKEHAEEENKLQIIGLSDFEKKESLGPTRNKSQVLPKNRYIRHSIAFGMIERRAAALKKQQSSKAPPKSAGAQTNKFMSLKHADEIKGGGQHMLTAAG